MFSWLITFKNTFTEHSTFNKILFVCILLKIKVNKEFTFESSLYNFIKGKKRRKNTDNFKLQTNNDVDFVV